MGNGLPDGWTFTTLGDLFELKYGKGLISEKRHSRGSQPVYGSNGVVGKHDATITSGPTIVIGRKGSVGEVHFSPIGCWPIDTTYYVNDFPGQLPPEFWALYLKSLHLGQGERSSAIPGINRDDIYGVEVMLPPLPEQRRIVAMLQELLAKVEACQKRLDRIPLTLKRFRKSVLDAATAGTLTNDWGHGSSEKSNTAKDLNAYIGRSLVSKAKKQPEQTEGHELLTKVVPASWMTPKLDDIFAFIDYRGKTPKKSKQGKRLITAKNIRMGYLSDAPIEYVSEDYYKKWMNRGFPKKDDIFFVTEGATMGFLALNSRDDEFAVAQRTITLQPLSPIDTRAFLYFMMSSYFQKLVQLNATGSAAVGIKGAKFRGLPIPFPPIKEQLEIVLRVGALFALADRIESHYTKAKAHVKNLTPSILVKAFRGELVPQDPNDEPATELLDRIKATHKSIPHEPRRGSKRQG